jgi:YidC/Oxa1 family membrane protein insertase
MERRTLIAVFLSFLVLYAYQAYFLPSTPPQAGTTAESKSGTGQAPAQPTGEIENTASDAAATPSTTPEPATAVPEPAAITAETAEREIVIDTGTVEAVISNRGARVTHWRLRAHLDDDKMPVDLVPTGLPAGEPSPFSLRLDDADLTRRVNSALYRVTGDTGGRVDATTGPRTVVFEFEDAAGVSVRKEFTFQPNDYVVMFSASVAEGGKTINPVIDWGPGLGDVGTTAGGGSFFTGNAVQAPQGIYDLDDKVTRLTAKNLATDTHHAGQFRFVGIDDHYFLAAALNPGQVDVEYRALSLQGPNDTQRQLVSQSFKFADPPMKARFFIGPKQFDVLRAIDVEFVKAINFGFFAWLVLPLLSTLKWVHSYVGNWGGSIILLTIMINLVMFPLRHKSVVSMRKMQAIQPQLKAIQDRYKDLKATDPAKQKMNTEVMNLYRERGVNPASGCVPMLLTFPVLLAFYSLLSQAIELRGAPFAGWIHDLSQHDPYYVTPLLMGASMFWQQRITPSTMDPAQAKMMMFMPVVFTAMFVRFPSGLAIYYFTSNLWTIGQQYFTNWLIGPPVVQNPRPPAERRIKSAGAGRTADAEPKS